MLGVIGVKGYKGMPKPRHTDASRLYFLNRSLKSKKFHHKLGQKRHFTKMDTKQFFTFDPQI